MWYLLALLACAPELSVGDRLDHAAAARSKRQGGEAEKILSVLRTSHADNARVWLETARVRQLRNDNVGAEAAYKAALAIAPEALDLKMHHAVFKIGRQGDQMGALGLLSEVWLAPEGTILGNETLPQLQAEALRNIAIAYQELNFAGMAADLVGRWRSLPDRNTKHEVIGTALMQRVLPAISASARREHTEALAEIAKDPATAESAYRALLDAHPTMAIADRWEAQLGLGAILRTMGKPNDSLTELLAAKEHAKTLAPAATMQTDLELARVYAALGQKPEALERIKVLMWWASLASAKPRGESWRKDVATDPALASLRGPELDALLGGFAHRVP